MFSCLAYLYFSSVLDPNCDLLLSTNNLYNLTGVPVVASFVMFLYGKLQHLLQSFVLLWVINGLWCTCQPWEGFAALCGMSYEENGCYYHHQGHLPCCHICPFLQMDV